MSGQQSIVAVGGVGLIGATFWMSGQRTSLDGLIWNKQSSPQAKSSLLQIAGESILVLILYLVAGGSDDAGNVSVVILVTLWILFFMQLNTLKASQKG